MNAEFPSLEGVDRIFTVCRNDGTAVFIYNNSPFYVLINTQTEMQKFAEFIIASGFTHNKNAFEKTRALIYERVVSR